MLITGGSKENASGSSLVDYQTFLLSNVGQSLRSHCQRYLILKPSRRKTGKGGFGLKDTLRNPPTCLSKTKPPPIENRFGRFSQGGFGQNRRKNPKPPAYGSGCTNSNQFLSETIRISENTRKQPIRALGKSET